MSERPMTPPKAKVPGRHTPGPWHAAGFCIRDEHDHDIAIVESETKWNPPFADGEAEANARLIAAAPAMALLLKLLSYGLARFEVSKTAPLCEFCFDGLRYVWIGDYERTLNAIGWDKAEAAIAKAEGR